MIPFSIREVRNLIRDADILGTVLEAILESLKTAKPSGTITPLELAPLVTLIYIWIVLLNAIVFTSILFIIDVSAFAAEVTMLSVYNDKLLLKRV